MDKLTIDAMVGRLELLEAGNARMERRLNRWRYVGGMAMLGAILLVVGGAQRAENPRIVEAERFVVRGQDGKERGFLGIGEKGEPIFHLKAKDGKAIASVYSSEDGEGKLLLFSPDGQVSVSLSAAGRVSNSPALRMTRDQRSIKLGIEALEGPRRPWLQMSDEKRSLFEAPEPIVKPINPNAAD